MNQRRSFVIYHLREVLSGALAQINGNEKLFQYMQAQAKLRLITMSDEELRELARMIACPPERPFEMVYREFKGKVEELKQTADDWLNYLPRNIPNTNEEIHYRVLIVENELFLRKEISSAFSQAGFVVSDAIDYSHALQSLNEHKMDVIVMESVLPDCDGFEACREFHSCFGVPVILMGEDSSDRVWARIVEVEADYYEIKPCRPLVLVARAKAILRRRKLINLKEHQSPASGEER